MRLFLKVKVKVKVRTSPRLRMLSAEVGSRECHTFALGCTGTGGSVLLDSGAFVKEGGATANLVGHPRCRCCIEIYGSHRTCDLLFADPHQLFYIAIVSILIQEVLLFKH